MAGTMAVPIACERFGPLRDADENGLRLPPGFTSRVVAVSGAPVGDTGYVWHLAPDGGATFPTGDGGYVYVSNSELNRSRGGVSAIRFSATAEILDAYSILTGTTRNCAGGPTPWGTWLSCEETDLGRVYECDPFAPGSLGVVRPAMGVFSHEAAAVDPIAQVVYLTEDRPDGLLYRFRPSQYPDLSSGSLEAAVVAGGTAFSTGEKRALSWLPVPDPSAASAETRSQVAGATTFAGGEGCWYEGGFVYFSTKGDNRVWKITTATQELEVIYDLRTTTMPELMNVDNVFAAPNGDVYVAEDPGNLQIVALTQRGSVRPIVEVTGQDGSEVTGPALSPDGRRLYFSSQRNPGTTYELTGPFVPMPPTTVGAAPLAYGQLHLAAAIAAWPIRRRMQLDA